jgi:hypothetical protein
MKRALRWLGVPALLACFLFGALPLRADPKPADAKIKLDSVKYDKMTEIIKGLKGKVVVVDFWADT